MLGPVT